MSHYVVVTGSFDDLRSREVRLLQEAAKLGPVNTLVWSDELVLALNGALPIFPLAERLYFLKALRYVERSSVVTDRSDCHRLPQVAGFQPTAWVVDETNHHVSRRAYCQAHGLTYRVFGEQELGGFPETDLSFPAAKSRRKKALVTGCFDWLHSGHVRFFEEASEQGDLYVVVGHDANVTLLKGEGHPLFPQEERRYMVQAVRHVTQALVSTGHGWMDAEPEIATVRPDRYVVNEDGDKPEKRAFCREHGIEYVVLRRLPKEGLKKRTSTSLRGF